MPLYSSPEGRAVANLIEELAAIRESGVHRRRDAYRGMSSLTDRFEAVRALRASTLSACSRTPPRCSPKTLCVGRAQTSSWCSASSR